MGSSPAKDPAKGAASKAVTAHSARNGSPREKGGDQVNPWYAVYHIWCPTVRTDHLVTGIYI